MDADGFTLVKTKRGPTRDKGRSFSLGYTSDNVFDVLHHAENHANHSTNKDGNLEIVMGDEFDEALSGTPLNNI